MGDKYTRWVQVEVGFPRSKLVDRARTDLGLDTDQAIGKLVRLWLAVMQTNDAGSLAQRSDAWIEEEVGWRGTPGAFAAFVREHHVDEQGVIRDWFTKYGKLDALRAKNRQVKQAQRHKPQPCPQDSPVDSPQDSPVDSPQDSPVDNAPCPQDSPPLCPPPSPVSVHGSASSSSSSLAVALTKQEPIPTQEPVRRDDPVNAVLIESGLAGIVFAAPDRATIVALLRAQRSPLAVAQTLYSHLTDIHGPASTPAALALAVREFLAAGEERFNARYFAAFVKRAEKVIAGTPGRVQARNEDRYIMETERATEREKREEAETQVMLNDFARTHGDEYETLREQAERSVPGTFKGAFRAAAVRAMLVKLVRERQP